MHNGRTNANLRYRFIKLGLIRPVIHDGSLNPNGLTANELYDRGYIIAAKAKRGVPLFELLKEYGGLQNG